MREQLVEGHTVFAVLEVVDKTTTVRAEFAAAVAVLVRENVQNVVVNRFPGVLWFNDQYLTNPTANERKQNVRYPCGGAVLAVQAGDADPRTSLGPNDGIVSGLTESLIGIGNVPDDDFLSNDNPNGTGVMPPGQPANRTAYGEDYAWLNLGGTPPYSDIPTGARTMGYRESYLITDPNDHMWQIDVYDRYSRLSTNGITSVHTNSTVWVVNLLGSPVFQPDVGLNCPPREDIASLYNTAAARVNPVLANANTSLPSYCYVNDAAHNPPPGPEAWTRAPVTAGAAPKPWTQRDNPPCGYKDPSQGSTYCYNGVAADRDGDGQPDCVPCDGPCPTPTQPARLYNALLYFRLKDFRASSFDAPRNHDGTSSDTNGCQVGTEWDCAGGDNAEGNSHPFRPTNPQTGDQDSLADELGLSSGRLQCPHQYGGANDSNHGGSTSPTYDCDYSHATVNIDIYFSGSARPFPPVAPNFAITDLQGSTAPFHYHP